MGKFRHLLRPAVERLAHRMQLKVIPYHEWRHLHLDPYDPDLLARIIGKDVAVLLDIGANEGQTVASLRSSFPKAHIYAFEPGEAARAKLDSDWGSDPMLTISGQAVTSHTGTVSFDVPESGTVFGTVSREEGKGGTQVPCTTLDDWADELGIVEIDLLKVDTEGHDLEVIAGATCLLSHGRIRAVVLEFGGHDELLPLDRVIAAMSDCGYLLAFTFEPWVELRALHHGNALFVRRDLAPNLRCEWPPKG